MNALWLVSDLHLGDPWAARMRYGRDNVAHHEEWMALAWDRTVAPDDDVWVLGDVSPEWSLEQVKEWLDARPGHKHLVEGNWDEREPLRAWKEHGGFDTAHFSGITLHHNGVNLGLIHRPEPMRGVDMTLHGHTHKKQKVSTGPQGQRLVNVCWEAWRRPASFEEVTTCE